MNKYTVIKNDDLRYLTDTQIANLVEIVRDIAVRRQEEGRKYNNTYLVINRDEPYADQVIEIMKEHGHWEEPNHDT